MLMTRVQTDVATVDVILLADGMSAATQEGGPRHVPLAALKQRIHQLFGLIKKIVNSGNGNGLVDPCQNVRSSGSARRDAETTWITRTVPNKEGAAGKPELRVWRVTSGNVQQPGMFDSLSLSQALKCR